MKNQIYQVIFQRKDKNPICCREDFSSFFTDSKVVVSEWLEKEDDLQWLTIYHYPQMKEINKADIKLS